MIEDLVAFLRARLDEDESVALAAAAPHKAAREWWVDPWFDGTGERADINTRLGIITSSRGGVEAVPAEHIARWDPARVLAEVQAKRQIVEEHQRGGSDLYVGEGMPWCSTCSGSGWPCQTLRLLALPYAQHEGYRDEWAPDSGNLTELR